MPRINTNIRPLLNSVHPGMVSGYVPCELSLEGEGAGKGKLWLRASSGNPAHWTSLDRVVCLGKHADVNLISTFTNSWGNYFGNYLRAGYYKDAENILWLQGSIKNGTVNADAFQLPAGCFDPAYRYVFPVISVSSTEIISRVDILKDGNVRPVYGNNTRFSLDGLFVPHGFCTGDCWGTCSSKCYGACTGSCGASSCSGLCYATCASNCYSACSSCADTCQATCQSSCSEHCYSACTTECGSNCTDTCYADCSATCIGNCYTSCLAGCYSSCVDTARHGVDPGGL